MRIGVGSTQYEQVESWVLGIEDSAGRVVRRISGMDRLPESVIWNGQTDAGSAPDGRYRANLAVVYRKGTEASVYSPVFTVDSTPPAISVDVDNRIFSPDGDGRKDVVRVTVKSSEPVSYTGAVVDGSGRKVVEISSAVADLREGTVVWDGKDSAGRAVADGAYYL